MLNYLKWLFSGGFTWENLAKGAEAYEALHGRPYFRSEDCPFSEYVRRAGAPSRVFKTTRVDN